MGNFKQEETQVGPMGCVTMKICLEDPRVYCNFKKSEKVDYQ